MMREFFIQQLDYIFFYDLSFFLMVVVILTLSRIDKECLPWRRLIFFGVSHVLSEWLDMVALSLGDYLYFALIRLLILRISFVFCSNSGEEGWKY